MRKSIFVQGGSPVIKRIFITQGTNQELAKKSIRDLLKKNLKEHFSEQEKAFMRLPIYKDQAETFFDFIVKRTCVSNFAKKDEEENLCFSIGGFSLTFEDDQVMDNFFIKNRISFGMADDFVEKLGKKLGFEHFTITGYTKSRIIFPNQLYVCGIALQP